MYTFLGGGEYSVVAGWDTLAVLYHFEAGPSEQRTITTRNYNIILLYSPDGHEISGVHIVETTLYVSVQPARNAQLDAFPAHSQSNRKYVAILQRRQ